MPTWPDAQVGPLSAASLSRPRNLPVDACEPVGSVWALTSGGREEGS